MSKSIKFTIIIFTSFAFSAALAAIRRIPKPTIVSQEAKLTTQAAIVTIEGSGFIQDFNEANKIFLVEKKQGKKRKLKKIKLKTIASTEDSITVEIPPTLDFGDYHAYVYLKTRFFKSNKVKLRDFIKLRPKAPAKPKLKYQVIKNINELGLVLEQDQEQKLELNLETNLETGKNLLRSFYYQDGFRSLMSEAVEIYYFEEQEFIKPLEINQEKPLISFAKNLNNETFEVSKLTSSNEIGLTREYYLTTPNDNSYLKTQISLSPIFIKAAHVKSPEYIIIKNRSSDDFDLSTCLINDSIATRYEFVEPTILYAGAELKIEDNLGLNDTGDSIELICHEQSIEKISYEKVNDEGFAIF